MERQSNHLTGESAERILGNALPPQWLLNEQKKDYGKDFLLEVANSSNSLTGLSAFVQLKGTGDPDLRLRESSISFSLKEKHARYYFENVQDLPVFLIVVDTQLGVSRYLFVQEQLELNQKWRKQKSVTLRIPMANDVRDHFAFF